MTTTWQPRQVLGERFERKGQFDLPLPREAHTGHLQPQRKTRATSRPGQSAWSATARSTCATPAVLATPRARPIDLRRCCAADGAVRASWRPSGLDPARGWLGARCGRQTDHERPFAPGAGIQPTLTGAQRAATARRGGCPSSRQSICYPPTSVYKNDVVTQASRHEIMIHVHLASW